MRIKMGYRGPHNDDGAYYHYEHEAEIRDEADATYAGREFARLCRAVTRGVNEGFEVESESAASDDDEAVDEADT